MSFFQQNHVHLDEPLQGSAATPQQASLQDQPIADEDDVHLRRRIGTNVAAYTNAYDPLIPLAPVEEDNLNENAVLRTLKSAKVFLPWNFGDYLHNLTFADEKRLHLGQILIKRVCSPIASRWGFTRNRIRERWAFLRQTRDHREDGLARDRGEENEIMYRLRMWWQDYGLVAIGIIIFSALAYAFFYWFLHSSIYGDLPYTNSKIAGLDHREVAGFTDEIVGLALPSNRSTITLSQGLMILASRHSKFPCIPQLACKTVPVAGNTELQIPFRKMRKQPLPPVLLSHVRSAPLPLKSLATPKAAILKGVTLMALMTEMKKELEAQSAPMVTAGELGVHVQMWVQSELHDYTYNPVWYANPDLPVKPVEKDGVVEVTEGEGANKRRVKRWKTVKVKAYRMKVKNNKKTKKRTMMWKRTELTMRDQQAWHMQHAQNSMQGFRGDFLEAVREHEADPSQPFLATPKHNKKSRYEISRDLKINL